MKAKRYRPVHPQGQPANGSLTIFTSFSVPIALVLVGAWTSAVPFQVLIRL
jgi:hypothetical protein